MLPQEDVGNSKGKEGEIIDLVIEGMSNKQIARRLFIIERTVETHLGHIFAKIGIKHKAIEPTLLPKLFLRMAV